MTIHEFYQGKKVFVTGHTGFKGAWLCRILLEFGAEVYGYALPPNTTPNLYTITGLQNQIHSIIADIRDFQTLKNVLEQIKPDIVFHLAAQPIVKEGYRDPVTTYAVNVMGTVNLMECVRQSNSVQSVVNVTTDKVYDNKEWCWGYREGDQLDGFDPYSNSKSCSELVTHSYIRSFFDNIKLPVSTVRAGNVIGGGDFSPDRIIPDCVRSVLEKRPILVRNPYSVRPYQHVLEPLMAYLLIAKKQLEDYDFADCYNVGPNETDCITTGKLVDIFCKKWGDNISWNHIGEKNAPHEANFLRLDCSKLKTIFGWSPCWSIEKAVEQTVYWTSIWKQGGDILEEMSREIKEYLLLDKQGDIYEE